MSTKSTLAHGEGFHIYQEIGDTQNVFLQVHVERGDVSLSNNHLTFSLTPDLLTKISEGWVASKHRFDKEPFEVDSHSLLSFLEYSRKEK